jgi:hypothetical protein
MRLPTRMTHVMSRIRFNLLRALQKDRLEALDAAAANCRQCAHACECDQWIASHPEGEITSPPDFCPNHEYLRAGSRRR